VQANGGTLFLDEIGETTLGFQVKLLRALQEGKVRPLGAGREQPVDARIIAATNRDLEAEVEAGRFRRDLFFRLNVFPISLPPLRSRSEDVVPLVLHFLERSRELTSLRGVAADARHLLETYPWPGNVRELENEVARIVTHAESGAEVTARMLSPRLRGGAPDAPRPLASETLRQAVARFESWYLKQALERNQERRIATARELGITRECLYKKLRRYGMQ
jgi:Nif-specific regulatory protein